MSTAFLTAFLATLGAMAALQLARRLGFGLHIEIRHTRPPEDRP